MADYPMTDKEIYNRDSGPINFGHHEWLIILSLFDEFEDLKPHEQRVHARIRELIRRIEVSKKRASIQRNQEGTHAIPKE
jgi:hypothetical protein